MSEIEKLLSEYPDEIADPAAEVCKLIYRNTTGVKYRVQFGWKVVIYEYEKGSCAVAPLENWVNLQFCTGKDLPDPLNLLEGTGKSMRHVKIRAPDDLGRGVISLVKAAAKLAHVKSR